MKDVIKKAINESKLNGHKWTVKGNKLFWSYLTKEYFEIETGNSIGEEKYVKVIYKNPLLLDETYVYVLVGEEFYCDAKTIEEAVEIAVKRTIAKANNEF